MIKFLVHCLEDKQFVDVFTVDKNASSRRITLYSSFDYSRQYPREISFFKDQLTVPTTCGTQVCQAEGFRLFKQASGRSGKVSPGTKELLF